MHHLLAPQSDAHRSCGWINILCQVGLSLSLRCECWVDVHFKLFKLLQNINNTLSINKCSMSCWHSIATTDFSDKFRITSIGSTLFGFGAFVQNVQTYPLLHCLPKYHGNKYIKDIWNKNMNIIIQIYKYKLTNMQTKYTNIVLK